MLPKAKLEGVRIHDLRHSFASVAIRDSISLMVIGKLLGHALAETTTRYAHLSDEIVADAAERVLYDCLENGLSFKVSGGTVLTLTPPLTITHEQMAEALAILDEACSQLST